MNDDTLKTLLSAYAAPTPDNGFSEAVLREAQAMQLEETVPSIDLEAYKPSRHPVRRSWIISLMLGLIVGLLWVRFGVVLPELPSGSALPQFIDSGWTLYAGFGVALTGMFLFMEADTY